MTHLEELFFLSSSRLKTHVGPISPYSKGFFNGGSRWVRGRVVSNLNLSAQGSEGSPRAPSLWKALVLDGSSSSGLREGVWGTWNSVQNFEFILICLCLLSISQRSLSLSSMFKTPSLIQCFKSFLPPTPPLFCGGWGGWWWEQKLVELPFDVTSHLPKERSEGPRKNHFRTLLTWLLSKFWQ